MGWINHIQYHSLFNWLKLTNDPLHCREISQYKLDDYSTLAKSINDKLDELKMYQEKDICKLESKQNDDRCDQNKDEENMDIDDENEDESSNAWVYIQEPNLRIYTQSKV